MKSVKKNTVKLKMRKEIVKGLKEVQSFYEKNNIIITLLTTNNIKYKDLKTGEISIYKPKDFFHKCIKDMNYDMIQIDKNLELKKVKISKLIKSIGN